MSPFIARSVLAVLSIVIAPATVAAQWRPTQAVKFVVHTSPGAGADLFARHIAEIIRQNTLLPVPVEVVNKSGGGGALPINFLAERKGDPTHIMAVTNVLLTTPLRQKGLPTFRDFQPVAVMAHDTNAIQVLASSPHKTVKDLIEAARSQPKKVSHAFGAFGGTDHIIGYQLAKSTGVQFSYVAFKGGGDAVTALLGGHVDFVTGGPGETRAHLQTGKLRALAVIGDRRLPTLPDVPTLKEAGIALGGTYAVFRGFVAPADVPREAIELYAATLRKVMATPAWKRYVADGELEEEFLGPAQMAKFLETRNADLARVLAELALAK
ncbi:MAG TPA: tripartite tricarboxylate transporter substrate binding protein [Burkholderiales bacterium]|nr:tripartite tricarboxylate transporter substrate binding protein [Burkholderiales bacterium]